MDDFANLIEQLTAIEEELRDRAYESLTTATLSTDGEVALTAQRTERKLLAARRAIAKAIGSLQSLASSDEESDG